MVVSVIFSPLMSSGEALDFGSGVRARLQSPAANQAKSTIIRPTTAFTFVSRRRRAMPEKMAPSSGAMVLTTALAAAEAKRGPVFMPILERPFRSMVNMLANRKGGIGHGAALMKVFLPYLTWNTVFDNTRATTELGRKPAPFSQYSFPLLKFSRDHEFSYPYQPWPEGAGGAAA